MSEGDRDDITERLGWKPYLANSADISWVRRPRMFWLSEHLPEMPWFDVRHFELAATVQMSGDTEPLSLWVPEGRVWRAEAPDLRFPTFTRPISRRRPPPDPAGLAGASEEARYRWAHDEFKFPPYTYETQFLLHDAEGRIYKLPASSRETLMGFQAGHTLRLDRELFKKTPLAASEDRRQAAIGNSFHTGTLASLLGAILFHKGFLEQPQSPDELLKNLVEEASRCRNEQPRFNDPFSDGEDNHETFSEAGWEDEDILQNQEEVQPDLNDIAAHGKLMSQLVAQFLRKVELRGSDVRLDSNVVYKPSACPRCSVDPRKWHWKHGRAFRWKAPAHINLLELRAALAAIQWRGRRRRYRSLRTLILLDSQHWPFSQKDDPAQKLSTES